MSIFFDSIFFLIIPLLVNISLNLLYPIGKFFGKSNIHYPLDFKLKFYDGRRILGDSTTIGGLVLVIFIGLIFDLLFSGVFGLLKALLVYFGHATGSFIKRRLCKKRGEFVPILNHGDYMFLNFAVFYFMGEIGFISGIISIVIVLIISPVITMLAHYLKIREKKI